MDAQNRLADDLLYGAEAIADYTGLNPRQVYHQQHRLGLRRLGSILVASKARLRKILADDEAA